MRPINRIPPGRNSADFPCSEQLSSLLLFRTPSANHARPPATPTWVVSVSTTRRSNDLEINRKTENSVSRSRPHSKIFFFFKFRYVVRLAKFLDVFNLKKKIVFSVIKFYYYYYYITNNRNALSGRTDHRKISLCPIRPGHPSHCNIIQ